MPFDSTSYVPKRPPHSAKGKTKRSKKGASQATKYSYKSSYQDEPQFAPPSAFFKGNSTNIDNYLIKVPPESEVETTEAPYVPPVSVQQSAREQYEVIPVEEAAPQYVTPVQEVAPIQEEVYPAEPVQTAPVEPTVPASRQRMPLLRGGASGLPQQPALTLRAGILHSSRPAQPPQEQPSENPQPAKKNKRKR